MVVLLVKMAKMIVLITHVIISSSNVGVSNHIFNAKNFAFLGFSTSDLPLVTPMTLHLMGGEICSLWLIFLT